LGDKSAAAKGAVRFSSQKKDEPKPQREEVKPEKTIEREPEVVVYKQIEEKPQPQPQIVAPKPRRPTSPPAFTLEDVSIRPKTPRLTIAAPPPFVTPPSSGESSASLDEDHRHLRDSVVVRSLEECIDIFDNGPRLLSASLSLLNDEELVLLAQNGKIVAYALEKVLGPQELERAVRIRRSLVCEYRFWLIYSEVLFLTW
jgi:hydroxymethylglutaryl-CoA reductase (NADPH)